MAIQCPPSLARSAPDRDIIGLGAASSQLSCDVADSNDANTIDARVKNTLQLHRVCGPAVKSSTRSRSFICSSVNGLGYRRACVRAADETLFRACSEFRAPDLTTNQQKRGRLVVWSLT